METLTVIIIGIAVLLVFDVYFIFYLRKKRNDRFKLVIEKGVLTEHMGNIPPEFLYDIQQLSRIYKPESLIINGRGMANKLPKMTFMGVVSSELQNKIEQSLKLSLQSHS